MATQFQTVIPNLVSGLRLLLVPVWLLAAEASLHEDGAGSGRSLAPLAILLLIGASDVADGYLARRWGVSSRTGATLDALADKSAQVVVVTWLALRPQELFEPVPVWFLGLLIGRDLVLGGGLLALRHLRPDHEVAVVHRWHGKLSSVMLFVVMVWCSARLAPVEGLDVAIFPGLGALIASSTLAYLRDGLRQLP